MAKTKTKAVAASATADKLTAAQVEKGELPRDIVAVTSKVVREIDNANAAGKTSNDALDKAASFLTSIHDRFDAGGYKAYIAKFFPGLSEARQYMAIEVAKGKKTLEFIRERQAGYSKKSRDEKAAREKAAAEELAKLKAGTAPGTLIQNGKAHPEPATPMVRTAAGDKLDTSTLGPKAAEQLAKHVGVSGNNGQNDAAVRTFAKLVTDLLVLTAGGVKPVKFVRAEVSDETLGKVAELCTGVVRARWTAAQIAKAHNQTVEQSAEAMKAKHAANENAAASAAA
jgi:hypothetical protein